MAEAHDRPPEQFQLRLRRYDPESGDAPYWDEHTIELEPHRSVLEAVLQARDRFDGSIAIRCSCRQALCGSRARRSWPPAPRARGGPAAPGGRGPPASRRPPATPPWTPPRRAPLTA